MYTVYLYTFHYQLEIWFSKKYLEIITNIYEFPEQVTRIWDLGDILLTTGTKLPVHNYINIL